MVVTKSGGLAPRCQFSLDKPYSMVYASNIIEKEVIMKIGTKIVGNYGAMIPLSFGEIVKVDKKTKLNGGYGIDVKWSNGSITKMMTSEVCTLELLPERGLSPIGYYTEEAYYAAG